MKRGTITTTIFMDIFVCAVGVKVFGWWAVLVVVGIYGLGWLVNILTGDYKFRRSEP